MEALEGKRALAARGPSALEPVTGPALPWVRDGLVVGLLTGYLGPAVAAFGGSTHPWLMACTVLGGLFGAGLGAIAPAGLEALRRRVGVATLVALVSLAGFAVAAPIAAAGALAVGAPVPLAATYGALATGCQLAVFLLPYLACVVLKRPRWPVVAGAVVQAAGLGLLARAVLVLAPAPQLLFTVVTMLTLGLLGALAWRRRGGRKVAGRSAGHRPGP